MNSTSTPPPVPDDYFKSNAPRPFMDLLSFNQLAFHLIATANQRGLDEIFKTFTVSDDGAHPKQIFHAATVTPTQGNHGHKP